MPVEPRLDALRRRLTDEGVSAMAVTNPPNLRYLTGLAGVIDEEPAHIAVVTATDAVFVTDSRYIVAATEAAHGTAWRVVLAATSATGTAVDSLHAAGADKLALESTLPYGRYQSFAEKFEGDTVAADGWVEALRVVKDADEIASITKAQELTDAAFVHLCEQVVRAGVTELEIALKLEFFMRERGSEGVAFSPIIASGPNAALPHAVPSERMLAAGDLVVLDFGARIDGYCADMTRTVVIGGASAEQRAIYDAVLSANLAGIAAGRAGLKGAEIDAAARAVIVERGYGEYFGHGLGHGVGLEVHELPSVGARAEKVVSAGSVITIEPGIYIAGMGGVRIEDLAVVEEGGLNVLTRSPKDLLEL